MSSTRTRWWRSTGPTPSATSCSARCRSGRTATSPGRGARTAMEEVEFHKVLAAIQSLSDSANKYIDTNTPWSLAKDPAKKNRLGTVLHHTLEAARGRVLLILPVT